MNVTNNAVTQYERIHLI